MKIVSSAIIFLLGIQVLLSQDRLASKVIFESGTEKIEGILIRPHSDHIMPAVVFQQGSGNHAFEGYEEEAWGPHRFYIEDVLLGQGYAVFYCNKRGLGNSSGNWKNNDFNGRAEDARAAVAYLRTRPDIDASRIGIAGHSQGGWVAQIAASIDSNIAFVISMAGPTVGVQQQTSMYDSLMYLCNGYPVEKLGSKMKKYRKRKKLAANIGKALPFIKSAYYWHLIYDYEHEDILKNLTCPALLLFAEHDVNVPPDQNIHHLNELFDHQIPSNITIEVMEGGQHGFYQVEDRCVDWDTATLNAFDQEFQNKIRKWLVNLPCSN